MSSGRKGLDSCLQLEFRELVGLYLFLREREAELDECLEEFLSRAEQELFRRLSIEEMEQLRHTYSDSSHGGGSSTKDG
ncbi:MAG: hypothetical protein EA428_03065 [Spirochaetaceae bacterium]|nr:MAG: hypothetical protein EA428_03065 [Spirochaetaceae bacterium]